MHSLIVHWQFEPELTRKDNLFAIILVYTHDREYLFSQTLIFRRVSCMWVVVVVVARGKMDIRTTEQSDGQPCANTLLAVSRWTVSVSVSPLLRPYSTVEGSKPFDIWPRLFRVVSATPTISLSIIYTLRASKSKSIGLSVWAYVQYVSVRGIRIAYTFFSLFFSLLLSFRVHINAGARDC